MASPQQQRYPFSVSDILKFKKESPGRKGHKGTAGALVRIQEILELTEWPLLLDVDAEETRKLT